MMYNIKIPSLSIKRQCRLLLILVLSFCILSVFYPVAASQDPDQQSNSPQNCEAKTEHTGPKESADMSGTISRQGDNQFRIEYELQNRNFSALSVQIPHLVQVRETHGFERRGFDELVWNDSMTEHSVTFQLSDVRYNSMGSIKFPSTRQWIVVPIPNHEREQVYIEPKTEGYIGSKMALIGEFETRSRSVGCQNITLVTVGESAFDNQTLDKYYDSYVFSQTYKSKLDAVETASRSIEAGRHHDEIHIFAVPESPELLLGGFVPSYGTKAKEDILVQYRAGQTAWIHEYIHTTQIDTQGYSLSWTREAVATYLSNRIAYRHGYITASEYNANLERGYNSTRWKTNLNSARTEPVAYYRGGGLMAELDADLSTTNTSFSDVLAWMYQHDDTEFDDLQNFLRENTTLSEPQIRAYDKRIHGAQLEQEFKPTPLGVRIPPFLFHPYFRQPALHILALAAMQQSFQILLSCYPGDDS